ncbi:hypothetical protein PENARI_c069G08464 [Penicillium arizonense]|uniref:Transcription factor domain-containing protein n=1 Tax=Penicillium arizonense TaxID=1835702 RepID=A0A1F5L1G4_PENAI|nr:hypothetical protein PENARI_c069G08464 [Penicillium arizonense]OGE47063.1 hypothetical protein PENARI_c069G08464 [Penicillium arizonense]
MTCVGGGQQRYKFISHKLDHRRTQGQSALQPTLSTSRVVCVGRPAQLPSTDTDQIAANFVEVLQVTDIRYAIVYYGHFLRDIPRRLGKNAVLDAAVKAISAASPFLYTGTNSPIALARYGQSLRRLRECLNDAAEARTPNTLCAVYLITICQSWLGKYDDSLTGHAEAISHLLKAAPLHEWNSRFELEMVLTMCIPVILEGIVNPRVKMDPAFWELASSFKDRMSTSQENRPKPSTEYKHLALFPSFVQNPDANLPEIENAYFRLKTDAQVMRQHLGQVEQLTPLSFSSPAVVAHSQAQAAYTMVSTLAVLTNSLLRIFDSFNFTLVSECIALCDEIATQAELATCYRPLGSAYMPLCLTVAWAALKDESRMTQIEIILAEYQSDFTQVPWMSRAQWLASTFDSHRVRVASEMASLHSPGVVNAQTNMAASRERKQLPVSPESCCIL